MAVFDVAARLTINPLLGLDHQFFARMHFFAFTGEHPMPAVIVDTGQELEPLVLGSHAPKPICTIRDWHLGNCAAHPGVSRRKHHCVSAAGTARAERADQFRVDVVSGRHIGDCVLEVL